MGIAGYIFPGTRDQIMVTLVKMSLNLHFQYFLVVLLT